MRGAVAKRLRRKAYGEDSMRARKYRRSEKGTIECVGKRSYYLDLKDKHKRGSL